MCSPNLNGVQAIEEIKVEEIDGAIGEFQIKSNCKTFMKRAKISYFLLGQVTVNKVIVLWIGTNNGLESKIVFPTYNSGYQRISCKLSIKEFFGSLILKEVIKAADEEGNLRTRFQFKEILKELTMVIYGEGMPCNRQISKF